MPEFNRRLPTYALDSLRELTAEQNSWWRSLLQNWMPSGCGDGLRLAIRDGYLNFYAKGQSIARITFGQGGKSPTMSIHAKYVTGDKDAGQRYEKFSHLGGSELQEGSIRRDWPKILQQWMSRSECYSGNEKKNIDALIAEWPKVIDLEMGLPAVGDHESAIRMDLVSLEGSPEEIRIVFWEAKLISDGRLRSRTGLPTVIEQVNDYRSYLEDNDRRQRVVEAYRKCCEIICDIHEIASGVVSVPPLDPLIRAASSADSCLELDRFPRLLIFDDGEKRQEKIWEKHLEKLRSEVRVAVIDITKPVSEALHIIDK